VTALKSQLVQREGRIVLSNDIHWAQPVAEIQDIKELYAEFVHIDVTVLQVTLLPTDRSSA